MLYTWIMEANQRLTSSVMFKIFAMRSLKPTVPTIKDTPCVACKIETRQSLIVCLFGLMLYVPVNSYGHVGMGNSTNHTFFLGKLDLAVNQYFVHILSLVTNNNPS